MLLSQAHNRLEEIFRVLLPQNRLAVREEQLFLSHSIGKEAVYRENL